VGVGIGVGVGGAVQAAVVVVVVVVVVVGAVGVCGAIQATEGHETVGRVVGSVAVAAGGEGV